MSNMVYSSSPEELEKFAKLIQVNGYSRMSALFSEDAMNMAAVVPVIAAANGVTVAEALAEYKSRGSEDTPLSQRLRPEYDKIIQQFEKGNHNPIIQQQFKRALEVSMRMGGLEGGKLIQSHFKEMTDKDSFMGSIFGSNFNVQTYAPNGIQFTKEEANVATGALLYYAKEAGLDIRQEDLNNMTLLRLPDNSYAFYDKKGSIMSHVAVINPSDFRNEGFYEYFREHLGGGSTTFTERAMANLMDEDRERYSLAETLRNSDFIGEDDLGLKVIEGVEQNINTALDIRDMGIEVAKQQLGTNPIIKAISDFVSFLDANPAPDILGYPMGDSASNPINTIIPISEQATVFEDLLTSDASDAEISISLTQMVDSSLSSMLEREEQRLFTQKDYDMSMDNIINTLSDKFNQVRNFFMPRGEEIPSLTNEQLSPAVQQMSGVIGLLEGTKNHRDHLGIGTNAYGVVNDMNKNPTATRFNRKIAEDLGINLNTATPNENLRVAQEVLSRYEQQLATEVPNWEQLSPQGKALVLDAKYNTGVTYRKLPEAILRYEAGDEAAIADVVRESRRLSNGKPHKGLDNRVARLLTKMGFITGEVEARTFGLSLTEY